MADLTPVFFDTTVLVAGLIDLGPASEASMCIFDALAENRFERPMTAWHCCLEFFSVATRLPEEFRLDPRDARQLLDQEVFPRLHVCALPDTVRAQLFAVADEESLSGGRIYDAHIGEVARHAGARVLVTDNRRHFSALLRHEIRVLSSADFASECALM